MYDELAEDLSRLYKKMFRSDNLIISYTSERDEKLLAEPLKSLISQLSDEKISDEKMVVPLKATSEGFKTSSKVQYACVAADYASTGLKFNGALQVLKTIMSYDYLWINVRVKGGAYGCMCDFSLFGHEFFVSYRDPNLKETYDVEHIKQEATTALQSQTKMQKFFSNIVLFVFIAVGMGVAWWQLFNLWTGILLAVALLVCFVIGNDAAMKETKKFFSGDTLRIVDDFNKITK